MPAPRPSDLLGVMSPANQRRRLKTPQKALANSSCFAMISLCELTLQYKSLARVSGSWPSWHLHVNVSHVILKIQATLKHKELDHFGLHSVCSYARAHSRLLATSNRSSYFLRLIYYTEMFIYTRVCLNACFEDIQLQSEIFNPLTSKNIIVMLIKK